MHDHVAKSRDVLAETGWGPRAVLAGWLGLVLGACTAVSPEASPIASPSAVATPTATVACSPPSSSEPSARGYLDMVSVADGVLLFGGQTASPPSGGIFLFDTWINRQADRWSLAAACPRPPFGTAIAYDAESDRVIMFGTVVNERPPGPGPETAETWAFDPNSAAWTNMSPTEGPANLFAPAMAYDAQSDRVILFGGLNSVSGSGRTWAYDFNTNTWAEMDPAASPPQRTFMQLAYDAQSDRVILFGGGNDVRDFDDTWAYDYDTDTWTEMSPGGGPPDTSYAAMAYDPATDRSILFGGAPHSLGEEPQADTWGYDFETDSWSLLTPVGSPSPRGWHAMARDPVLGLLVLFGGGPDRDHYQADTWLYDPLANTWSSP